MNTSPSFISRLVALFLASMMLVSPLSLRASESSGPDGITVFYYSTEAGFNSSMYQAVDAQSYTVFFNNYASFADSYVYQGGEFLWNYHMKHYGGEVGNHSTIYSQGYEIVGQSDTSSEDFCFYYDEFRGTIGGGHSVLATTTSYAGFSTFEDAATCNFTW